MSQLIEKFKKIVREKLRLDKLDKLDMLDKLDNLDKLYKLDKLDNLDLLHDMSTIMIRVLCKKLSLLQNDNIWNVSIGIKFYCPLYPWDIIQRLIVDGNDFFEIDILNSLKKYIPSNAIILDIGTNIGNHSIFWATVCGAKKVHAFEPIPHTYSMLLKNITLNGLEQIIIPYNIGLGAKSSSGETFIHYADNIGGTSIIESLVFNDYSLKIQALDDIDLCEEKIDFVKIDVENFELQALAGMQNTLKKYKPVVFIESFESGHGYKLHEKYDSNAPKVREFFKNMGGYDEAITTDYINWLFVPH